MKRIADRAWTWILCLLVCVGAVCFLIGRLSAGDAVRMQTEKSSASTAEAVRADDAATEAAPAPQPSRDTSPLTPAENLRLDLNKATKEELMQLPHIGETLAGRILSYREENDGFMSTEQLMDVDGIGEATYAALKDLVTVEVKR